MRTFKIAVTIGKKLLARLDQLVKQKLFPSRSRAVQEAIRDKLDRVERGRLARECAKVDPRFERALADEEFVADLREWEY
jgi:metal-responsive CopG/Arc/MetJ family transcriptional regulator